MRPAAETSSSSTHRSTRMCRNSTMSNSSTKVSASSTKVWASSASSIGSILASFIGSILLATADDHQAVYLSVSCLSGHSSSVVVSEADAAGHYVGGQLRQGPVVGERAGSQAGESLAHGDAELN